MASDIRLEEVKVVVDGPLHTADDTFVPIKVWNGDAGPVPSIWRTEMIGAGKELTRLRDAVALLEQKVEEARVHSTITAESPHYTQDGWRWCSRCRILHFAPNVARSVCAADPTKPHSTVGSGSYVLFPHRSRHSPQQGGWTWCNKCQGLYHSVGPSKCAAGGEHDLTGSPTYVMSYDVAPQGIASQSDWRFCNKCHSLFHSDNVGVCPGGSVHTAAGSIYFVAHR